MEMHPNLLHDYPDVIAMLGPSVEAQGGDEHLSVQVGNAFGATALTEQEWAALAASRGDKPYVLVDFAPDRKPLVSPLRTYAAAMAEFNRDVASGEYGDYSPHTGRRLVVMSQDDYLKAREGWGQP